MFIKTNWLARLGWLGFASMIFSSSYTMNVSAQGKSVSLLSTNCIRGKGEGQIQKRVEDIPVGQELLTSIMYMKPGNWWGLSSEGNWNTPVSMVCRLRPENSSPKFKSLRLSFGMGEQIESPNTEFTVYVDGNEAYSVELSPGQKRELFRDITATKTLAFKASCSHPTRECQPIYIFRADLDPIKVSPGSRY